METDFKIINVRADKKFGFVDVTDDILMFVNYLKISTGQINVQLEHSSAGMICNENEWRLLEDFEKNLRHNFDIKFYRHDDIQCRRREDPRLPSNECKNADSHCWAVFAASPSVTLNIINGSLRLGNWPRVMFWELDEPRERTISIVAVGDFDEGSSK